MATQEALFGPPTELQSASRNAHFAQAAATSRLGQLPNHDPKSGQLPLMMTAREIRHHYRALDADRIEHYDYSSGVGETHRDENDDELFERKFEEAHDAPHEYGHMETSPNSTGAQTNMFGDYEASESSLHERLVNSNFELRNPVSLQFHGKHVWPRNQVDPDTGDVASDRRPQILGGHHRVALLEHYAPDKLQPVNHEENIQAAKKSLGDRY